MFLLDFMQPDSIINRKLTPLSTGHFYGLCDILPLFSLGPRCLLSQLQHQAQMVRHMLCCRHPVFNTCESPFSPQEKSTFTDLSEFYGYQEHSNKNVCKQHSNSVMC